MNSPPSSVGDRGIVVFAQVLWFEDKGFVCSGPGALVSMCDVLLRGISLNMGISSGIFG